MKKKLSEVKELKRIISDLKERLSSEQSNNKYHRDILNDIADILDISLTYSSANITSLRKNVAELVYFKKLQDGAYHPLRDTIETQREIIRWLIKPSSADNYNELNQLKKNMRR